MEAIFIIIWHQTPKEVMIDKSYLQEEMASFSFGRVNYKSADRYILQLYADGSSLLASGT